VSVEDLARSEESVVRSVEERYREALEEVGGKITYPDTSKRLPRECRLAKVTGKPLSEQIIEDRR
jgi:hypothetical protein